MNSFRHLLINQLMSSEDWTGKPSDWSDIRVNCPKKSIALYAAHASDFSSYDNLGFTATMFASNLTATGSPTITDGVATNLDSGYYSMDNFPFASADWEIVVKANTEYNSSQTQQRAFCRGDSFQLRVYGSNTRWQIYNGSVVWISPDESYSIANYPYAKLIKKNSLIDAYLSTDGITYEKVASDISIGSATDGTLRISYPSNYWLGSIDLNETYVKVGNSYFLYPYGTDTGYKVFIDGTQYGTTYASGSQCSITWSTSGITTGDDITTPSALKAHKIWIEPATEGNNITAFHCDRVAASGTEQQGLLWAHFNLTNEINIQDCFYSASTFENRVLTACTAKNNKISLSLGLTNCFYNCVSLEYVPVFIAPNTYRSFYGAFRYCYKLKNLTIKNLKALSVNNFFTDARSLEKLNLPNADFSRSPGAADFVTNASNLEDTEIDARTGTLFTRLGCYGSSSYFMGGFKGLRVSNQAPFSSATAPQINVSYTGMDRAALVQLFNDLPYNVGYEVVGTPTINNGIVSNIDNNNYVYLSSVSINNSAIKIKAKLKTTRAPGDYTDIYFGNNSYLFFATSWGSAVVRFRANISDNWNTISIPLSSFPMQEDTYYWFEYSYDGIDTHTLKLSSDGETWVSNSLTLGGGLPTSIATFRLTTERTLEIDLNNTFISLNDIPYFTGKATMTKTLSCVGATGTADLTADDKDIALNKGWSLTLS